MILRNLLMCRDYFPRDILFILRGRQYVSAEDHPIQKVSDADHRAREVLRDNFITLYEQNKIN